MMIGHKLQNVTTLTRQHLKKSQECRLLRKWSQDNLKLAPLVFEGNIDEIKMDFTHCVRCFRSLSCVKVKQWRR